MFADLDGPRLIFKRAADCQAAPPQAAANVFINIIHAIPRQKMIDVMRKSLEHTLAENDRKHAARDYICEMLLELSTLAAGMGELEWAADLRQLSKRNQVPVTGQGGLPSPTN